MSQPGRTYLPFVIMFLLAAHMLPIDHGLVGSLWYLRQRAPLMYCPQVAALMFLLAQIVLIYLVGRIVAWLIPRHTSPTIYQIRLSTCFVIMLAASVILFANVNSYDYGS